MYPPVRQLDTPRMRLARSGRSWPRPARAAAPSPRPKLGVLTRVVALARNG